MKFRFILWVLLYVLLLPTPAAADWRWAKPHFKLHKVAYFCDTVDVAPCVRQARALAKSQLQRRIAKYNHHKELEWEHWTNIYIPDCIWYGESGEGPEYDPERYTMPNQGHSGALGKFQFMPGTYFNNAKYGDWSPLDQEIAARREYWKHGSSPWENC